MVDATHVRSSTTIPPKPYSIWKDDGREHVERRHQVVRVAPEPRSTGTPACLARVQPGADVIEALDLEHEVVEADLPRHLRDGQRVVPAVAVVEADLHELLVHSVGQGEAEDVAVEGVRLRQVRGDEDHVPEPEVIGHEARQLPPRPEGPGPAVLPRHELVARPPRIRHPGQLGHTSVPTLLGRPRCHVDAGEPEPVEIGRQLDLVGERPPGVEQLVPVTGADGDAVDRVVDPQPHGAVLTARCQAAAEDLGPVGQPLLVAWRGDADVGKLPDHH